MKKGMILFALLALVQLAVPAWMIALHEIILRSGKIIRLRTAPVDPYDAFRGRYVQLGFEPNHAPLANPSRTVTPRQTVYVLLAQGPDGFARFTGVAPTPPASGDYLQARVSYVADKEVFLQLPFSRYYMNEKLAPQAETAYRERSSRVAQDAYVTIRVKNGVGVLEELYLGGKPIREYLAAH